MRWPDAGRRGREDVPTASLQLQAWKLFCALVTCGLFSLLYYGASEVTASRSYDLATSFDRAIPFVPWTWWLYFPGYLCSLLLVVFAMRRLDVYYRTLLTLLVAQCLITIIYLIVPSTFPRPVDWGGTGFTADAIRWFWTIDPPNNTFPSSHVTVSVIAALAMLRERNPLFSASALFALVVIVTVHTTKQHYWVDAVGGIAVALACYRVMFGDWPQVHAAAADSRLIRFG